MKLESVSGNTDTVIQWVKQPERNSRLKTDLG